MLTSSQYKKIVFIINPVSGIGKQKSIEKIIKKILDPDTFSIEIAYTQHRGHATEIAAKAANKNTDIVVAVGGDGSVNEVGKGIVNTSSAMGIIPTGSGNGLARHLGIPLNIPKAIQCLGAGTVTSIDTIDVNGHFGAGVSGVGLDAQIGWKFAEFGKRGFSSYLKIFLKEFFFYKKRHYSVIIDGIAYERDAMLISLANSSQFGNNAYISPQADIRDGQIDVCILKPFPKVLTPYLVLLLFTKTINKSKYMEIIRGKTIQLIQEVEQAHIDGEPLTLGKKINAKVNPLSLKVVVPKK